MEATTVHKFEAAGLGKAPFKFVNVIERVYVSCPGAIPQPSGTCAYCGNGIKYCCVIVSSDGKSFEVGNECVKKTDDAGLVRKAKAAITEEQRKKRVEREFDDIRHAKAALESSDNLRGYLATQRHPNSYFSAKFPEYNLLTYHEWVFDNASHSTRVKSAQSINTIYARQQAHIEARKENKDEA